MTNRTVAVSLTAQVSNYVTGFEQVNRKNKEVTASSEAARKKFEDQNAAMSKIGAGVVAFGALAAVAVGVAVAKFADFDAAMSNVEAATHESAANMALLRDAALDAGARTVFSATEAANAIEELGKAGLSTSDILNGGLDGALDLAAAGGIGVAEAAGIAATALKQFKLEGQDMAHVADLLAAGAGKAMGDVTDLSAALSQSGMVAASTGLSIEETTGTLAAFASQGLLGSDAGTSFKAMLQRLTPQSKEAADKMAELGISAYDAGGNFIGMEKFAGNLQTSLKGLTTEQRNSALATIFGSDAVRAATVLYSEGSAGISDWNEAVDDSGYAAETARMRLDNLKGDVEALGGAFDTALIKSGSAADGTMRFLVQAATELIDVFNDAPLPIQQTALAVTAVAAAAALAGGAFLLGVPKIAEFSAALAVMSTSQIPAVAAAALAGQTAIANMGKAAAATAKFMTGPWGIAMVAAGIGVKTLTDYLESLRATSVEMENSLLTAADAADILTTATKGQEFTAFRDMGAVMSNLGTELDRIADQSENFFSTWGQYGIQASKNSLGKIGEELSALASKDMPAAQRAFGLLADETDGSKRQMNALLDSMPSYRDALIAQASELDINIEGLSHAEQNTKLLKLAQKGSEATALEAADAYLATSDSAETLNEQLQELINLVNEANGVGQDAVSQNNNYANSLADVDEHIQNAKKGIEGYALGFDQATQAGRDNEQMLVDLAADSQAAAKAQFDLDGNTANYRKTLEAGRQAVIDRALALGATADEAKNLADKIYAIPTKREFEMIAKTAAAAAMIARFKNMVDTIPGSKIVSVGVQLAPNSHPGLDPFKVPKKADGGAINGPGGPREDNHLIWASSGEHMLDAEDVKRMGGQSGVYKFRQSLYEGATGRAAVQYAPAGPSGGGSGSGSSPINVVVTSKGGVDLLRYVDVQIEQAGNASELKYIRGRQS